MNREKYGKYSAICLLCSLLTTCVISSKLVNFLFHSSLFCKMRNIELKFYFSFPKYYDFVIFIHLRYRSLTHVYLTLNYFSRKLGLKINLYFKYITRACCVPLFRILQNDYFYKVNKLYFT